MAQNSLSELTNRENEVLELIAHGWRNKEVSQKLHISISTTQNHLRSLYKKLKVRNRTEAAQKYWKISKKHFS